MRSAWKLSVVLLLLAAPACKPSVTPIKTLLDDPGRYDKQVVRIAGTVGTSVGALGYGGYQVDDGSGTLMVVTNQGGVPREGAKIGVEGEFRSAYTIGTHTGAVLVERERFTP